MIKEILENEINVHVISEGKNEDKARSLLKIMGIEPESIEVHGNAFTMELKDKEYGNASFDVLDKFAKLSKSGNKPKIKRNSDTSITMTVTI